MSQSTRRWISDNVKSLRASEVLPFYEHLDAAMVNEVLVAEGGTFKDRIYTPLVTLCMFLSQVIDPDHSCRASVARLIVWLAVNHRKTCAPDTSSYCEARLRLPERVIVRLVQETARRVDRGASDEWLWKGRRVTLVDGTTVSMPDTKENQKKYPQSKSQKVGLGFPIARLVALVSLATGVVRDLAIGPYQGKETGETALFRTLWDGLEQGEIVLGDRLFCSFFGILGLSQHGVDGLFRMHQLRKFDFSKGRCLGIEDHIVTWSKPQRPKWMDKEMYDQIPETLTLRELRVTVDQPGFRVNELVLVTTMLDAETYTKEDVAGLFLERWKVELDFRAIKDVMQMDVLRCKTPAMVRKEIWTHLLAYNLIRGVMSQAAEANDKKPRQVSFKGALQTMTAFQDALRWSQPAERAHLMQEMLKAIASHEVGDRPGRCEPRANKRRPKSQGLLAVPRSEARKALLGEA